MSDLAKFSIVITNHNYESFLADCIDSALSQIFDAYEVIVVDDGSTDRSRSILGRYSDVCNVIYQSQGGQGAAMLAGYHAAVGEYVLFLDADDLLYEQALSTISDAIGARAVAKLHFALDVVDAAGEVYGRFPRQGQSLSVGHLQHELIERGTYCYPPCSGNVFSREFLGQVMASIDTDKYRICADLYLLMKCPGFGEILAVETSLGAYRVHGNNAYGVTRVIELEPQRLKRRLEALQNKCSLLELECELTAYEATHARRRRWVGLFGYKDQILAAKFFPEMPPLETASVWRLVWDFLGLLAESNKLSFTDKVKGVLFAVSALGPKCVIRGIANWHGR